MKILLFGKHGQLGWELNRTLQCLGQVLSYDLPEVDFMKPRSLRQRIQDFKPRIVVNAAAYTDVDGAEIERDRAKTINSEAPGLIARLCRASGASLIHYSTDYVFDGKKGTPYFEDDPPNPLNVYGQTKLDGERAVMAEGGTSLIFRTAWVYSLRRDCFVTKVLRWSKTRSEIRVVDDQVSNPTWARHLAEITALLLANAVRRGSRPVSEFGGIYHLAGWGMASRLQWAKSILGLIDESPGREVPPVRPAKSGDFPAPAARPALSALDCGKFFETFGLRLPDWEMSLRLAIEEISGLTT